MEAAGFTPEDFLDDYVELWPENWTAWRLFCDVSTQWRMTMSGPAGLDYMPLFRLMDEDGLRGEEWRETFHSVQVLERAALAVMREQNK